MTFVNRLGRRLYLVFALSVIGFWTLLVFPSSLIVTLATGSHRIGHRLHSRLWGRNILRSCGVRLRVHGLDHLPEQAAVLLINHGSFFGGFAVAAALPIQWRAVLDRKFRRLPVFGWIGVLAGHVFLDRSGGREAIATLNAARSRLDEGISLLLFPEGRYDEKGRLHALRKGGFHLALAAKAPIVVLTAVESVTPRMRAVKTVDLHVSDAIPTTSAAEADLPELLERVRREMLRHANDGSFRRRMSTR